MMIIPSLMLSIEVGHDAVVIISNIEVLLSGTSTGTFDPVPVASNLHTNQGASGFFKIPVSSRFPYSNKAADF